jgi:hypothetical protein
MKKTRHCKRPCCEASKVFPTDKVTEKTKSQNHYRFRKPRRAKLVDMYSEMILLQSPTSGVIEIIETTLSKKITEDLQKIEEISMNLEMK